MESRKSMRLRSTASRTTESSFSSSSAKTVKLANETTLSKFSQRNDKFDVTITSNGTETPKSVTSPMRKVKGSETQFNNAVLDANEYKEIVSKLKRASSQEILDYYNKFGSMWFNEFPKTDYVYSPTSENYGKEVAPGIPMKPNMSRSPIRSQNHESLPRSRLDTTDKSYEASARTLFPLDADSRVNLENELREKSSSFIGCSSYNYNHSRKKSSTRWYHFCFSIFTIVYSWTLGRAFSDSSGSNVTYQSPYVSLYRGHPHNAPVASWRWYYAFTRFLYRSLFLFQWLDVVIISSARSTIQKVFRPVTLNFGHNLKPFAVVTLCLPLILLSVLYWWPESYISFVSYFEEIFMESPTQVFSKSVTSIYNSLSSWFSDFSLFLLLRPFINIYELFVAATSGTASLLVSTISYLTYLIQTGIFTAFSLATTPFVVTYLKLSEVLVSVAQHARSQPYQYQTSVSIQTPNIDYKILAENLLKSSEMRKTFNDWLSEQSELIDSNHKQTSTDSAILVDRFKQFLLEELDDREQNVQLNMEQKNVVLKEELKMLKKELEKQEDAETVARTAIYNDLLEKINNIQNQLRWQALRLRRCCSNRGPPISARTVEKHVITYLSKLLSSAKEPLSQDDIRSHLDAIYVARDRLENKLSNLTYHLDHRIREASEASMDVIMAAVTERMGDELSKRVHDIVSVSGPSNIFHSSSFDIDSLQQYINRTVEHVLSLYDADKTGMADYALESSGGTILNIKCTESSSSSPAVFYFYGIPVWWTWNNPRKAIQPGMQPGECWSFVGSTGYLVIQLSAMIKIHTFSVEHIPKSLSRYGSIDSAPKDFSVWGLKEEIDKGPYFLGKFRYEENGTSLQYFSAQPQDKPFNIVELRIESNWGNLEYTCLYRFRVHGVPV